MILAMFLGAWTAPTQSQSQQGGKVDESSHPNVPSKLNGNRLFSSQNSKQLSAHLAQFKDAQQKIDAVSSYQPDINKITNDSPYDKAFVEEALTSNSIELWTMEYVFHKVQDPDLKNLVQVMLVMHTEDQKQVLEIAKKFGIDTVSVDIMNASVYPETPDWDLGKRTENLREDYLDPLVENSKQSFDERALDILDQEHTSDIQSELTAERTIVNPELKAFAKNSADVTELHLQLLDVVHAYMQQYDEPPSTDMNAQYMSPRDYVVHGQSSSGK